MIIVIVNVIVIVVVVVFFVVGKKKRTNLIRLDKMVRRLTNKTISPMHHVI